MKRPHESSGSGIKKFFIRQSPSVPNSNNTQSICEPVQVADESSVSSDLIESQKRNKHRTSGFDLEWKKEFPWVEQHGDGKRLSVK